MIKCTVKCNEGIYQDIIITDHANYAEYGSDIVCSAVSMLAFTIGQQIMNIDESFNLTVGDNRFEFKRNIDNEKIDLLLDTLYLGLKSVEQNYGKFLKIKEV